MSPEEFIYEAPGRLVRTLDGHWAFDPAPVPRRLDLDLQTVTLLSRSENALGRLEGAVGRMVNPFLIGSPLLRREAICSSRIEGTVTTPEQLVLLEAGVPQRGARSNVDTKEVLNYVAAMTYGLRRLDDLPSGGVA